MNKAQITHAVEARGVGQGKKVGVVIGFDDQAFGGDGRGDGRVGGQAVVAGIGTREAQPSHADVGSTGHVFAVVGARGCTSHRQRITRVGQSICGIARTRRRRRSQAGRARQRGRGVAVIDFAGRRAQARNRQRFGRDIGRGGEWVGQAVVAHVCATHHQTTDVDRFAVARRFGGKGRADTGSVHLDIVNAHRARQGPVAVHDHAGGAVVNLVGCAQARQAQWLGRDVGRGRGAGVGQGVVGHVCARGGDAIDRDRYPTGCVLACKSSARLAGRQHIARHTVVTQRDGCGHTAVVGFVVGGSRHRQAARRDGLCADHRQGVAEIGAGGGGAAGGHIPDAHTGLASAAQCGAAQAQRKLRVAAGTIVQGVGAPRQREVARQVHQAVVGHHIFGASDAVARRIAVRAAAVRDTHQQLVGGHDGVAARAVGNVVVGCGQTAGGQGVAARRGCPWRDACDRQAATQHGRCFVVHPAGIAHPCIANRVRLRDKTRIVVGFDHQGRFVDGARHGATCQATAVARNHPQVVGRHGSQIHRQADAGTR